MEDTQPFSHPSAGAGGSLSAYRSLPNPSPAEVEGSEGLVRHRMRSVGTGLQHSEYGGSWLGAKLILGESQFRSSPSTQEPGQGWARRLVLRCCLVLFSPQ